MKNALEQLDPKPERALIDGESLKDYYIPNEGIVGGDDTIDSIKAASIIAKVTRDNIMKEYSLIFPEYGFENNSGYGTKFHMEALEKYKATPIHRKSFKPVTSQMPTFDWLIENKRIDWIGIKLAALYLKKYNTKKSRLPMNIHILTKYILNVVKINEIPLSMLLHHTRIIWKDRRKET